MTCTFGLAPQLCANRANILTVGGLPGNKTFQTEEKSIERSSFIPFFWPVEAEESAEVVECRTSGFGVEFGRNIPPLIQQAILLSSDFNKQGSRYNTQWKKKGLQGQEGNIT